MSDRIGTLDITGDHATIRFVRRLSLPVDRVWAAITESDKRAAWFGETSIDGRVGGTIDMIPAGTPGTSERKRVTGSIRAWETPHVLEHDWRQSVVEDGIVRYELAGDGDGTYLTFTHSGLSVDNARGFIPGTHAFLDRLDAYLSGDSIPDWNERYQQVAPEYQS